MKQTWSPNWKSSVQPRKQRKHRHNAPLHARRRFLSAHLSPALREAFKRRSLPLRKGDEVTVMRGSSRGKKGQVDRVDLKRLRVTIDSIKVKKADGSEVHLPFQPSNLLITRLALDDPWRKGILDRSGHSGKVAAQGTGKKKGPAKAGQGAAQPEGRTAAPGTEGKAENRALKRPAPDKSGE